MNEPTFQEFPKMARFSRECIITEKIDGTNAQLLITEDGDLIVGSRTRWITPQSDNHGFAAWAYAHKEELLRLGPGRHFGEWWGNGIQRGYGLKNGDKRLSLFNVTRWCLHGQQPKPVPSVDPRSVKMQEVLPEIVGLVPALWRGAFDHISPMTADILRVLREQGSFAVPGYMKPEGVVVFHTAGNFGLKKTLEKDDTPKSLA
jgi:hypothetical protein